MRQGQSSLRVGCKVRMGLTGCARGSVRQGLTAPRSYQTGSSLEPNSTKQRGVNWAAQARLVQAIHRLCPTSILCPKGILCHINVLVLPRRATASQKGGCGRGKLLQGAPTFKRSPLVFKKRRV